MVVRITSPHSLQKALNYNEQKCQKEKATCIFAGNYFLDASQMNFHQKMERMQELISLNERTKKTNTLHISLNFDPSEKTTANKLSAIAQDYMQKIGFGNQPYLVYQHIDAGHPHIHIVSTNIQEDGKRIDTYNIGRNQSEKARKEIEIEFALVKAEGRKLKPVSRTLSADVQKVHYGRSETRRSITNVLDTVVNHFKYTSLAELNAILRQYNIVADRGKENGVVYKSRGLVYRLLDEKGNKIGVPIKASLFYSQPTLKNLEKRFADNDLNRQPDKRKLKTAIDWILGKSPANLTHFIQALQKEKIQTVLRQNKDGLVYGITFIDYRSKSVFNGSDLGKQYSIGGIQQRLTSHEKYPQQIPKENEKYASATKTKEVAKIKINHELKKSNAKEDLLKELTSPERLSDRIPFELRRKRRKKRNNNL